MAGALKLIRPFEPDRRNVTAMDMFRRLPEQDLAEYERQVEAYNRLAPRGKEYSIGYVPDDIRGALSLLKEMEGTVGREKFFDFVPASTKFVLGAQDLEGASGEVRHDMPDVASLSPAAGAGTFFHEAAHVDSLTGPNQRYASSGRFYPGYERVVRKIADLMPESRYYQKAYYGGEEEAAARLRALYAMQPAGTDFRDFMSSVLPRNDFEEYGETFYDKIPGESGLSLAALSVPTAEAERKVLEHTLFPRKRFIEEREPTLRERIRDVIGFARGGLAQYGRYHG